MMSPQRQHLYEIEMSATNARINQLEGEMVFLWRLSVINAAVIAAWFLIAVVCR